jgi:hypothetical protein
MSMKIATVTTGNVLGHLYHAIDYNLALLVTTRPEMARSSDVRINAYTPVLATANAWLAIVEARIRASIRPEEQEGEESTEWLNRYAADAAISFFRNVGDLLPAEPHIAATRSGDLVAEFETPACSMTSVISRNETILFGICKTDRSPIHAVVRRGSNSLREEVKTFTRELNSVSHGIMGASG